MRKIIQVHVFKGETRYVAECLDLPIVTQGETLDELAANLREAIALHLEGEGLSELRLAKVPESKGSMQIRGHTFRERYRWVVFLVALAQAILKNVGGGFAAWQNLSTD